jgi:hypothetical protein
MPGETELHKTLKKEACRWLYRVGYRCIAAEVKVKPLGIIDAVGTGVFGPYYNYLKHGRSLPQVCFVECKASRADFLRDLTEDGQMHLAIMEREANKRRRSRYGRTLRQRVGLGKFSACLMQPMANIHYILAPAGMIKKEEIPPRWGLLSFGDGGINVVHKADWQDQSQINFVEGQIARTLTMDIYRADDRAMMSVNREIFMQQQQLAQRIREVKAMVVETMQEKHAEEEKKLTSRPSVGRLKADLFEQSPLHAIKPSRRPRPRA